jgi:transposase-like protein
MQHAKNKKGGGAMIERCTHCGSKKYVKDGKAAGKQRYVCKECRRSFGGGKHSLSEKLFAMQKFQMKK